MSNIAFTVVQNDMVILNLWLKYYSRYFDDLFVIRWRTKKKYRSYLENVAKEYSLKYGFINESVKRYGDVVGTRKFIQDKQVEFLEKYDWVLYCNCDEILVPKKNKYEDLRDLMRRCEKDWIACEGYELIQVKNEGPIDYSFPYFKQRKYWIKNVNYNKIILSRIPLDWVDGTHKLSDMTDDESKAIKNTSLYLIHLKHADLKPRDHRDLGPFTTNPDPNIMEHWLDKKEKKPSYLNKLL